MPQDKNERVINTVKFSNVAELRDSLSVLSADYVSDFARSFNLMPTNDPQIAREIAVEQHDSRQVRAFEVVEREENGVKTIAIRFVPWVAPDVEEYREKVINIIAASAQIPVSFLKNDPAIVEESQSTVHPELQKIIDVARNFPGGPKAYAKAFNELTPDQIRIVADEADRQRRMKGRADGHTASCAAIQFTPGPCNCGLLPICQACNDTGLVVTNNPSEMSAEALNDGATCESRPCKACKP